MLELRQPLGPDQRLEPHRVDRLDLDLMEPGRLHLAGSRRISAAMTSASREGTIATSQSPRKRTRSTIRSRTTDACSPMSPVKAKRRSRGRRPPSPPPPPRRGGRRRRGRAPTPPARHRSRPRLPVADHRLTYPRTNHASLHGRGYKEKETTTTPFRHGHAGGPTPPRPSLRP
jgi:hypothetical protein